MPFSRLGGRTILLRRQQRPNPRRTARSLLPFASASISSGVLQACARSFCSFVKSSNFMVNLIVFFSTRSAAILIVLRLRAKFELAEPKAPHDHYPTIAHSGTANPMCALQPYGPQNPARLCAWRRPFASIHYCYAKQCHAVLKTYEHQEYTPYIYLTCHVQRMPSKMSGRHVMPVSHQVAGYGVVQRIERPGVIGHADNTPIGNLKTHSPRQGA